MSNKRITDLTELINPTTDDVFPVVDIATNTTTKVQLGNIPLPTSVINALSTKENTITGAATTITSANLTASRAVISNASGKVAVSSVTDTELGYVSGVTSAIQTQIDAKQATLVSGTNIKTINSTSLLGSGNISIQANPSGVAGAIQFSDGSAFASDAANFFWDNTNKRLGVGTTSPIESLSVQKETTGFANAMFVGHKGTINYNGLRIGTLSSAVGYIQGISGNSMSATYDMYLQPNGGGIYIGSNTNSPLARLHLKGSGSTSATTSLLVQNSSGTDLLKVQDNGQLNVGGSVSRINSDSNDLLVTSGNMRFSGVTNFGIGSYASASAVLQADSTTKGFLPPRMTTTQKNAIASPAAGLVVYDSTTNKLCCYNGSTWNDLF